MASWRAKAPAPCGCVRTESVAWDVVEVEGDPSAKKGGKGKGGRTNTNANETTC